VNDNLNNIDKRKIKLLKYAISILAIMMLAFSILNLKRGLLIVSITELTLFFIGLVLLYFTKQNKYIKVNIIILLTSIHIFTIFVYTQKGIHFTTFIWTSIVTGLTLFFIDKKRAIMLVTAYLIVTYSIFFYFALTTDKIPLAAIVNIGAFIFSYTAFIFYYELTREEAEEKLKLEIKIRREIEEKNKVLISDLQDKMNEIKQLSSFLPICSSCKKVRDDNGYWEQIEHYISKHSDTEFSHSLCPSCTNKLYPEFSNEITEDEYNNK